MMVTLKAARVNAGFKQAEAAKRLNVAPETLSRREKGKSYPSLPMINKIEKLYGVSYANIKFLSSDIGLTEEGGE